jgi:hypothetical protein
MEKERWKMEKEQKEVYAKIQEKEARAYRIKTGMKTN